MSSLEWKKLGFSCIVPEISYIHFCNPKVIDSRKTQVTVIGCVIMLQFAPRLTKPQGHLYHESIGDAIEMLNVKLKVKHIGVTGNMVLKFIMKCILRLFNIDVDIWYSGLWLIFYLNRCIRSRLNKWKGQNFQYFGANHQITSYWC